MKHTRLVFLVFMNLIAALFHFGCKTSKPGVSIFPYVQTTPDDSGIIFPFNKNEKTGFYKINTTDSLISEFLPPQQGILSKPTLSNSNQLLFFSYAEKNNNLYNEALAALSLKDSTYKKIKKINLILIDIIPSKDINKLYIILANEINKSSPLVSARPKIMNIYTYSILDSTINIEFRLDAYSVNGKSFLDYNGENLFMNITFHQTDSAKRISGPYKINLKSKKLTYLVPNNLAKLHPDIDLSGITKEFYTNYLYPMPSKDDDIFFLKGVYDVYKVDQKSMNAEIIYSQTKADRFEHHLTLKGIASFNNKNDIIIIKQTQKGDAFLILNKDNIQKIYPLNMDKFIDDF